MMMEKCVAREFSTTHQPEETNYQKGTLTMKGRSLTTNFTALESKHGPIPLTKENTKWARDMEILLYTLIVAVF